MPTRIVPVCLCLLLTLPAFPVDTPASMPRLGHSSDKGCAASRGLAFPRDAEDYGSPLVVQFPCDVTVSCDDGFDPEQAGKVIRTGGCGVSGVAFSDQKLTITDACYKILRTWTVQSWCDYHPDGKEVFTATGVDPSQDQITLGHPMDSLIEAWHIGIGKGITLQYVSSESVEIPGLTEGDVFSFVRVSDSTFSVHYNTTRQEPVDITGIGVGPHFFRYVNSKLGLPVDCGTLEEEYPFKDWYADCCQPGQARAWKDDGDGYFQFTQIIMVKDHQPPSWEDCADQTFCLTTSDCGPMEVILTAGATDVCTPPGQLKYQYAIDLYQDGTVDETGNSSSIQGTYPVGHHRITHCVTDQCCNWNTCTRLFTISDCLKPVPVCLHNLSVSLMETSDGGMAEIWTSSLEAGVSADNCTEWKDLSILAERAEWLQPGQTAPGAGAGPMVTVDCDDIPPHSMSPLVEVAVWVGDQSGNWDYCLTSIWVQDNMGVCDQNKPSGLWEHVQPADQDLIGHLPGILQRRRSGNAWSFSQGVGVDGEGAGDAMGGQASCRSLGAVFPNPARESTRVCFHLDIPSRVVLTISDMKGVEVYRHRSDWPAGAGHVDILRNELPGPGLYLVRMAAGDRIWSGKLVMMD
ncbi:MAG: hypothetical protein J5I41_03555 [Saprospiraceae bacterium]|nr:hypothetical protein [Saprospiraceae bacterium]